MTRKESRFALHAMFAVTVLSGCLPKSQFSAEDGFSTSSSISNVRAAAGSTPAHPIIKGDVTGSEDMTIDGHIEGRIDLKGHNLLIGPNATIEANVTARTITIMGAVTGDITASEKVDLRASGSVEGDLYAPRVVMADAEHDEAGAAALDSV